MKRNLSVFLDFLRFIAALSVILGHSRGLVIHWLPGFMNNANEAVAVFFVLSGFVIRFVSVSKEVNWKSYAIARIMRIYPVAIVTICFTLLIDYKGKLGNPAYYASLSFLNTHTSLVDIASYLTFTSEIWLRHAVVGSAEPYWSLSYEVCYYIFFGVLIYSPSRIRIWAIFAWMLFVGPKILIYLPLWLLGAACYEVLSRIWGKAIEQQKKRWMGYVCSGAGVFILLSTRFFLAKGTAGIYHFQDVHIIIKSVIFYLCIGVGISLVIVGFDMATSGKQFWPPKVEILIRWLAGGSFTLYLIHQPLMVFFVSLFPAAQDTKSGGILLIAAVLVSAYVCAELAERRKRELKVAVDKLGQMIKGRFVPERS